MRLTERENIFYAQKQLSHFSTCWNTQDEDRGTGERKIKSKRACEKIDIREKRQQTNNFDKQWKTDEMSDGKREIQGVTYSKICFELYERHLCE